MQPTSASALLQVYVVGEVGIMEELELKGIQALGGPEDAGKTVELKAGYAMPHDKDVSLPVDGNAVCGSCDPVSTSAHYARHAAFGS